MFSSTLKLAVGLLPPAAESNGSYVKGLKVTTVKRTLLPLQTQADELSQCHQTHLGRTSSDENQGRVELKTPEPLLAVSRRDTMLGLATASMSGLTHFLTEPVEARVVKSENKRKIMEKLKMLREKAGMSKPKTEDEKASPPKPLGGKELPPIRNPLTNPTESLVEAFLP